MMKRILSALVLSFVGIGLSFADDANSSLTPSAQNTPITQYKNYDDCYVNRVNKLCKVDFDKCLVNASNAQDVKTCGKTDDDCNVSIYFSSSVPTYFR